MGRRGTLYKLVPNVSKCETIPQVKQSVEEPEPGGDVLSVSGAVSNSQGAVRWSSER